MKHMKIKEQKQLRTEYLTLKDTLIKTLDNYAEEAGIDFEGDETDLIQANALATICTAVTINHIKKLRAINEALKLLDQGEYGICEECGECISFKRLQAIPGVTLCITCAEQAELEK